MHRAVRRFLAEHVAGRPVAVACSGGADSLALAAAAVRAGATVHGLVVDHGLQPGSRAVADRTAATLRDLGCADVRVLPVTVDGPGGPEAAARRARYAALRGAAPDGALVLLGHTRDDQAETVLLGLGRGSGPRSLAGMRPLDPPWGRPLLGVGRADTEAACAALGLRPWRDPHNADPRFRRVRLRTEVLPLLDDVLGGGAAAALARTAAQLREDLEVLDGLADDLLTAASDAAAGAASADTAATDDAEGTASDGAADVAPARALSVPVLAAHPAALRRRVLRRWLLDAGAAELTDAHLRRADALVGAWRGQGPVALPGGVEVRRERGRLCAGRRQRPDTP